jgi:SecD-like export protein
MKTVSDILRDADPLRDEPHRLEERDRLREAILAAASGVRVSSSAGARRPLVLVAAIALLVVGIAIGSKMWSGGGAALQAAVRFEVRLAEAQPTLGLRPVRIAGTNRVVYLHPEIVVANGDISQCRVIEGSAPYRFSVAVEFNAAGAEKMRKATAGHIGGPLAILIDGDIVAAPTLKSPISTSAVISGDFTQAEAERIVGGISVR